MNMFSIFGAKNSKISFFNDEAKNDANLEYCKRIFVQSLSETHETSQWEENEGDETKYIMKCLLKRL